MSLPVNHVNKSVKDREDVENKYKKRIELNVIRNFMQMADGKAWLSEESIEASLDPVFKIIKKKDLNLPIYSIQQSRVINLMPTLAGRLRGEDKPLNRFRQSMYQ